MTTAAPSTALATIQPAFTDSERLALAGFLAGYRGLTREAYALDLRQFNTWCRARSLPLFVVRRADIESFAGELEARGRARATVTRRLCTIAGFYKYAVEEELLEHFPGRSRPPSAAGLRVPRGHPGPQRARRAPGRRRARPTARACADLAARVERAAGLGDYWCRHRASGTGTRAPDADDYPKGRQGSDYPAGAAHGPGDRPCHRGTDGRAGVPGRGRAPAGPAPRRAARPQGRPPRGDRQGRHAPHAEAYIHHRSLDPGVPLRDVQEAASHADLRTTIRYDRAAAAWTGTRPTSWQPTSRVPPDNPRGPGSLLPGVYGSQAEGPGRN